MLCAVQHHVRLADLTVIQQYSFFIINQQTILLVKQTGSLLSSLQTYSHKIWPFFHCRFPGPLISQYEAPLQALCLDERENEEIGIERNRRKRQHGGGAPLDDLVYQCPIDNIHTAHFLNSLHPSKRKSNSSVLPSQTILCLIISSYKNTKNMISNSVIRLVKKYILRE